MEYYSEQEKKRLCSLTESEMLMESNEWGPAQWIVFLSKGNVFDDKELDRFFEEEIIKQ